MPAMKAALARYTGSVTDMTGPRSGSAMIAHWMIGTSHVDRAW